MRKFITAIVILAIIWALPPVRARLGAAVLPTLEKLGPRGEVVIRPARREAAKKQIRSMLRVLATDVETGREVPDPRRFQAWIGQRMPELTGRDPWGNPYWLETRDNLTIGSNGPDGERGTDDDIRQTAAK